MLTITLYDFDELSFEAKQNAIDGGKKRYRECIDGMVAQYIEDYLQQRGYAYDSIECCDDRIEITWQIPKESPLRQGCAIGDFAIKPSAEGHKVEFSFKDEAVPPPLEPTAILRQIEDEVELIAHNLHADLKPQIKRLYGDAYAEENLRAETGLLFFADGSPVVVPDDLINQEE